MVCHRQSDLQTMPAAMSDASGQRRGVGVKPRAVAQPLRQPTLQHMVGGHDSPGFGGRYWNKLHDFSNAESVLP